jgi:glycosyltransferase involved in cell wall biosynthesis
LTPVISLVIPCFNEEESLDLLYRELCAVSASMGEQYRVSFEFLLINDGSRDKTLHILRELAEKDDRFHYISFSRNFGKESCIYAGLQNCIGDYIAVLDADLQHPPSMLPQMYEGIINEGYDCVAARRISRQGEPAMRSFFARSFYRMVNRISKTKMVDGATDFSMMTRQVVEAILTMKEYNRFSKGIYSWVGFETKWLPYRNVERVAGSSKWSFWKLFLYSLDGIISFSTAPLTIATVMGVLLFLAAFVSFCVLLLKCLIYGSPFADFPVLTSIVCLIGGIQLLCIGILGQYLAKTYTEVKNRPIYLIKESRLGASL